MQPVLVMKQIIAKGKWAVSVTSLQIQKVLVILRKLVWKRIGYGHTQWSESNEVTREEEKLRNNRRYSKTHNKNIESKYVFAIIFRSISLIFVDCTLNIAELLFRLDHANHRRFPFSLMPNVILYEISAFLTT